MISTSKFALKKYIYVNTRYIKITYSTKEELVKKPKELEKSIHLVLTRVFNFLGQTLPPPSIQAFCPFLMTLP